MTRARSTVGRAAVAAAAFVAGVGAPALLRAQTPGPSVNMVSGTSLPGGDPYLQRQNEPSIAVSTRNPDHLLAGANDYRTVDLPGLPDDEETGDSWVGLFSSLDGGQTWTSTLVPGYPQDTSPEGLASPLKGTGAAADPVVRAGTHGLFYYGLLAFDRDAKLSRLAVARFVDLNDREGGDLATGASPIRYAGTSVVDEGTSGQFVDKPWLAVDVPRAGAATCLLPTSPAQSVPAGAVYMAWARLTGSRTTKVMLSRSLDCGATWSAPVKLSEGEAMNQGLALAIDPATGDLHVAWRRFAGPQAEDAIVHARSSDRGETFTKARELVPGAGAPLAPFDQAADPAQAPYRTAFRTTAYPALAVSVDETGKGRVHVAWARRASPGGEARIVLSTSEDAGLTWSEPVSVDAGPLRDDFGGAFDRGHQFMPQLASRGGRLVALYYDTRLDHTRGVLTPGRDPALAGGQGPLHLEQRVPQGELALPGGEDVVFGRGVDDAQPPLVTHRHTVDVRVAQLDLRAGVDFEAPRFTSAQVSRFPFGPSAPEAGAESADSPDALRQLKFNPPNLPLFAMGTTPFVGDYIDIAGLDFVPGASGEWRFATDWVPAPVFHAVWTSNEDVRPPPDGDWTSYTPPGKPGCVPGREGMRNQNVYAGRITQGLAVSSPRTAVRLTPYDAEDPGTVATLVVEVQNATGESRAFRLLVLDQPAGGFASFFLPREASAPPQTSVDVQVPPQSATARTVFAASSDAAARIRVEVAEILAPGGERVAGGLAGFVTLNADPTVPLLQGGVDALSPKPVDDATSPPEGSDTDSIGDPSISNPSISNPSISNPSISNPSISNPSISNPSISNPSISNPSISNPSISNPSISNPSISNPSISNPSISNFTFGDSSLSNPSISNEALAASAVSDANYTVTNTGRKSTAYRVKLVGDPAAARRPLRLFVTKAQRSPASQGCELTEDAQTVVLADVAEPPVEPPAPTDLEAAVPRADDATFTLRPGETAQVTVRARLDPGRMKGWTAAVVPVVTPQGVGTGDAPLALPAVGGLPRGRYGVPYSAVLEAFGGKKPYTWRGDLPRGLRIEKGAGVVSGAPLEVGEHEVTFEVEDRGRVPRTIARRLVLAVDPAGTTLAAHPPERAHVGEDLTIPVSVEPEGEGTPTGTVELREGDRPLGPPVPLREGVAAFRLSDLPPGVHALRAVYSGDPSFLGADLELSVEVEPREEPDAGTKPPKKM